MLRRKPFQTLLPHRGAAGENPNDRKNNNEETYLIRCVNCCGLGQ
jgi:hypothetical protein